MPPDLTMIGEASQSDGRAKLTDYVAKWSLSDVKPLAQTETSQLYLVRAGTDRAVLKLLTEIGKVDERSGATALHLFSGHGAVKLLESDENAQLLEYAPGPDLTELVRNGRDSEAAEKIAKVLSALHSVAIKQRPQGLISLESRFRSLFDKATNDDQAGLHSVYMKAAVIARNLLDTAYSEQLLHGDMHHENVRLSSRGWLAIDPKGLWGERTYDAANTVCNPVTVPGVVQNEKRLLRITKTLAEELSLDADRLLRFVFVHAALWASWALEDKQDPTHALAIGRLLDRHVA